MLLTMSQLRSELGNSREAINKNLSLTKAT